MGKRRKGKIKGRKIRAATRLVEGLRGGASVPTMELMRTRLSLSDDGRRFLAALDRLAAGMGKEGE